MRPTFPLCSHPAEEEGGEQVEENHYTPLPLLITWDWRPPEALEPWLARGTGWPGGLGGPGDWVARRTGWPGGLGGGSAGSVGTTGYLMS